MIFTLTDRDYNPLDVYETTDYLIGVYTGYVTKSLEMSVLTDSANSGLWAEGNYILCKDKEGYQYWFTIYKAEDSLNGSKRELQCYSGSLDIMNEDANPIPYPANPLPFESYFQRVFGGDSGITIGINEIADMRRSLEFTSENASMVEMIQYVLNGFDNAEGDFVIDVEGSVVKSIKLNVFKRIGKVEHQDILTDDNDSLISLDRTGSIEELATAIKPYAQQSDNTELTLAGKYYEEKDPNTGEILYISEKNSPHIKSRKAHKNFFVNLENKAGGDNGYIVRRYSSQAKTQDALWAAGLTKLKEIDHPIFKYEVKGTSNAKIGDNVQIISKKMSPALYLEARLMELKFNDDIPNINEYTFGNYKTLESNLNTLDKWMDEIKKQLITIVPPIEILYAASDQGVDPPETGWIASIPVVAPGMYLWSKAITTFSNGDKSTSYVSSRQGENGEAGEPGKDGEDGQTPYLHVAYANSEDGSKDFSTTVSKDKEYMGSYTDYLSDDSQDYRKYTWMKVKGDPGLQQFLHIAYANSEDGTKDFSTTVSLGKSYIGQYNDFSAEDSQDPSKYKWSKYKGDPGENAEQVFAGYVTNQAMVLASTAGGVVTDYTTAKGTFNVSSGNVPVVNGVTFSVVQQSNMKITIDSSGNYQVTELNSDNGSAILKAVYEGLSVQVVVVASKSKQGNQGTQGTPGETGADGKPVYIHIAYANSADGKTGFSITDSNRLYVGQYVDNSAVNSTDPTKYKWSKIKGEDGTQGAPGAKGEDGRTPYFHTAWANSADGLTDFSTNDPTGRAYLGSYSDFTSADSTDPTKYYWSKIKGDQGPQGTPGKDGADGDPTGITKSDTVPPSPYAGMLWQCTSSTLPNYTKDAIYRWNGSKWELFIFTAVNIIAESLSALSANLGNITSGNISGAEISGSKFVNTFTDASNDEEAITGNTTIENGYLKSRYKYNAAGDNGVYQAGPDSTKIIRYDSNGFLTKYSLDDASKLWKYAIKQEGTTWQKNERTIGLYSDFASLRSEAPDRTGPWTRKSGLWISPEGLSMESSFYGIPYTGLDAIDVYNIDTAGTKLHTSMPGGAFLTANQTITPSKKLSQCLNGWIVEFQGYLNGAPSGGDLTYCPIPKVHAKNHSGGVMSLIVVGHGGDIFRKIVYVTDNNFSGHANNGNAPANKAVYTNTYSY